MPWLPRRRSLLGSELFEPTTGRLGPADLVLARSLCHFGRFDLRSIPSAKRTGALRLQLGSWAPFREPGYAVAWSDGQASVWCWDATRVRTLLTRQGKRIEQFRLVLPESSLHPGQDQGLRLLRCVEGYEAQFWASGTLQLSRWWPAAPGADDWLAFMRGAGVPPEAQSVVPAPLAPGLQAQPWARVSGVAESTGSWANWEPLGYATLLLALSVPATAMALREWQLQRALWRVEQQLGQLRRNTAPLLAARQTALGLVARIQALDDLQRFPHALAIMAAVADTLPADGVVVREWEMADGHLKMLLASAATPITGTAYVAALEKTGLFDDIKMISQADPKLMGFSMQLRSLHDSERPLPEPRA